MEKSSIKTENELLAVFSSMLEEAKAIEQELMDLNGCEDNYNGPKVVAYASTRNRYSQMERAAKTLIANGNVDKIYFLIEDEIYPNVLPECIETINVSNQKYFANYGPNVNTAWTHMAFMRLAFHKIFPDLDRILWLDTDTLVLDDISQIFQTPMRNYYFGAVKENLRYIEYLDVKKIEANVLCYDIYPQIAHQNYYNSGVLLENLKLLRESGMGDRIINYINNYRSHYPDQNIINQLCRNRIYTLSHEYNWSYFTGDTGIPRIIHTSCGKPTPEIQNVINMYEKLSFEQITNNRNESPFVYNPNSEPIITEQHSESLEAGKNVEDDQSSSVHWH